MRCAASRTAKSTKAEARSFSWLSAADAWKACSTAANTFFVSVSTMAIKDSLTLTPRGCAYDWV